LGLYQSRCSHAFKRGGVIGRKKRNSNPVIWKLQSIKLHDGWWISGVILSRDVTPLSQDDSWLSTFVKTTKTYLAKPFSGLIRAKFQDDHREITSDKEGAFAFHLKNGNPHDLALTTGRDQPIPISQSYPQSFDFKNPELLVISDIDDTILISKSSKFFSKLWLMLFRQTAKRNYVEESEKAYRLMKDKGIPFFYVSASEANLFATIANFLQFHELPIGPIFLRPFTRWNQLLRRVERKNYKEERIREICRFFPASKIVLFGDDSQDDPKVFQSIIRDFPDRIRGVFIRQTGSRSGLNLTDDYKEMGSASREIHHFSDFEEIRKSVTEIANDHPDGN